MGCRGWDLGDGGWDGVKTSHGYPTATKILFHYSSMLFEYCIYSSKSS